MGSIRQPLEARTTIPLCRRNRMLVEHLIGETLEARVLALESVVKAGSELVVTIVPVFDADPSPLGGSWCSPGELPGDAL